MRRGLPLVQLLTSKTLDQVQLTCSINLKIIILRRMHRSSLMTLKTSISKFNLLTIEMIWASSRKKCKSKLCWKSLSKIWMSWIDLNLHSIGLSRYKNHQHLEAATSQLLLGRGKLKSPLHMEQGPLCLREMVARKENNPSNRDLVENPNHQAALIKLLDQIHTQEAKKLVLLQALFLRSHLNPLCLCS